MQSKAIYQITCKKTNFDIRQHQSSPTQILKERGKSHERKSFTSEIMHQTCCILFTLYLNGLVTFSHICGGCINRKLWLTGQHSAGFQPTVLTVALLLHCCVCRLSSSVCLSATLCIVAKRCVLEQKLLWRAYRKSYMRNRLVPK